MEFSDLGSRCSLKECNQQDYLPFKCNLCNKFYCLKHKSYDQHNCENYDIVKKPKTKINKTHYFICQVCNRKELFEIKCSRCNKIFCLQHRHQENHDCIGDKIDKQIMKNDRKKCIIS